jgi:hypothetical protein
MESFGCLFDASGTAAGRKKKQKIERNRQKKKKNYWPFDATASFWR